MSSLPSLSFLFTLPTGCILLYLRSSILFFSLTSYRPLLPLLLLFRHRWALRRAKPGLIRESNEVEVIWAGVLFRRWIITDDNNLEPNWLISLGNQFWDWLLPHPSPTAAFTSLFHLLTYLVPSLVPSASPAGFPLLCFPSSRCFPSSPFICSPSCLPFSPPPLPVCHSSVSCLRLLSPCSPFPLRC